MLTLANFEAQVNSTILERGKQYYKSKAVSDLEEDEDHVWLAEVEGSETYQVEISLGKKKYNYRLLLRLSV